MERILKLITIDGPSASGKSSVSRALAKKLNWPWLSTGVFYRGIALVFIEKFLSGDSSKRDLNNFKNCFSVERSISNGQKFLNKADMGNRVFEGSVDMEVLLSLISEPNWKVLMDENRTRFVFKGEDLTGRVFSPGLV